MQNIVETPDRADPLASSSVGLSNFLQGTKKIGGQWASVNPVVQVGGAHAYRAILLWCNDLRKSPFFRFSRNIRGRERSGGRCVEGSEALRFGNIRGIEAVTNASESRIKTNVFRRG